MEDLRVEGGSQQIDTGQMSLLQDFLRKLFKQKPFFSLHDLLHSSDAPNNFEFSHALWDVNIDFP